jgi:hypothetical protein
VIRRRDRATTSGTSAPDHESRSRRVTEKRTRGHIDRCALFLYSRLARQHGSVFCKNFE